eukprot:CAMPEP_0114476684 /NCGR_PEP_ID=MMETSP0104-20121206/14910_1 /TAXON_ID=37642 ORGANISM="Paraphysomonas imperforata, Strain PA2" /NCGR_SAMPLE_ID=MMETSP0104 /ASSEMBLY_ACC=CAM_ASM_000202 /LENGTH=69 /DNA_ID=CAMNT_0001651479 /DNA_START=82 /DNA_END=288 /DNA_ORIENTATION=+
MWTYILVTFCSTCTVLSSSSKTSTRDVSELPSSKTFQILGMSVYDNPDEQSDVTSSHWWKWFMPSYHKE